MNIKEALLKKINNSTFIDSTTISSQDSILNQCALVLKNGAKMIHFYNKALTDEENIQIAIKLRQLCSIYDGLLIINSRIDIAQIVYADGVCLFDGDMSVEQAKKINHDEILIGVYTKKLDRLLEAQKNNTDFICVNSLLQPPLKEHLDAHNKIKIINLDWKTI